MNLSREEAQQILDALWKLQNRLDWFRESYPQDVNWDCDDAANESTAIVAIMQSRLAEGEQEPCQHNYLWSPSYGGKLCADCGKPEKHK